MHHMYRSTILDLHSEHVMEWAVHDVKMIASIMCVLMKLINIMSFSRSCYAYIPGLNVVGGRGRFRIISARKQAC